MPLIRRVTDPNSVSRVRTIHLAQKPALLRFRPPPRHPIALGAIPVTPDDHRFGDDEIAARLLANIRSDAEKMSDPRLREMWLDAAETFAHGGGDVSGLVEVTKWRRPVVPLDEFVFGDAYLGIDKEEIFPAVWGLMQELDTDQYNECVLGGALGIGKSFSANLMTARNIYKISCMRHPQTTFGLQARSAITFTIQSIRLNTAKKAVFEELGQYILHSPYFNEIYPYDKYVQSNMIFREQRVVVMPVSSSITGVISMNVIGGQLDEANFFQRILKSKSSEAEPDGSLDQAKKLYDALARRRKSRFVNRGRIPGMFFIISSAKYPDDFTARKASEAKMCGGVDPGIYVWNKSQWDVKPARNFMREKFRVQVGNELVRSKVLDQIITHDDRRIEYMQRDEPHHLCEMIEVPMDFYPEFVKDPDGSLRDFAGVTSQALRPFMPNREKVLECMDYGEEENYVNPFQFDTYDLSLGIPSPDRKLLRTDIDIPRACHIDLGLKRDAAGVAIGHVVGIKLVERRFPGEDRIEMAMLPVVAYDVILRIVPPPGGEIEFSLIRKLIKDLRDVNGLPIKYVTLDGFQSVDTRQILKTQGFMTDYLSVEGIEEYNSFKEAVYDVRCLLHRNQFLAGELAGLQYTLSRSGNKETIDHRNEGSKDVADAVCGVYAFLMNRKSSWRDIGVMNRQPKLPQTIDQEDKPRTIILPSHSGMPQRRVMMRPNPVRSNPVRVDPARR